MLTCAGWVDLNRPKGGAGVTRVAPFVWFWLGGATGERKTFAPYNVDEIKPNN